jgi:formylglycine-generating enzyme required for sulfatase activity
MMGTPKKVQDEVIAHRAEGLGKASDYYVAKVRAEGPPHEVEITRPFYLGVYEVTQGQFRKVMGYNPSHYSKDGTPEPDTQWTYGAAKPAGGKEAVKGMDSDEFPVENVSWDEAVAFCKKLSELPAEKKAGRVYRLPTEAEWEYACRGGASSYQKFHYGNSLSAALANCQAKLERTCKVGSYKPNSFGLYDMHGNVAEWCSDWYGLDYYGKSPAKDPTGPATGQERVYRGGAHPETTRECQSGYRRAQLPIIRFVTVGIRVALVAPGK